MSAGPLVVTYPLTGRSRAIVAEELGGTAEAIYLVDLAPADRAHALGRAGAVLSHDLWKISQLAGAKCAAALTAPLFASLLSIPTGGRYPPLALSAAQQRRLTLAALLDQLEALARQKPVLMLFEDAHWADATSLEVLDLTVERVRAFMSADRRNDLCFRHAVPDGQSGLTKLYLPRQFSQLGRRQ
jgi:hypothetical protein